MDREAQRERESGGRDCSTSRLTSPQTTSQWCMFSLRPMYMGDRGRGQEGERLDVGMGEAAGGGAVSFCDSEIGVLITHKPQRVLQLLRITSQQKTRDNDLIVCTH